jgi:DNA-binding response OmpR family regulator
LTMVNCGRPTARATGATGARPARGGGRADRAGPDWPRRAGAVPGDNGFPGWLAWVGSVTMRILVAEDDKGLGAVLVRGLGEQGYVVDLVPDGETAVTYLALYPYAAAVVDWRMPKLSGLDLVARMRREGSALPVLMLTARDTPADRVTGLDAGADDYLVRPFDFGELLARLRALLRRPAQARPPVLSLGDLELDPATREVRFRGQQPALTGTEFGILEILLRRAPGVADRRMIALHVWEDEADAFGSNTIDVHLARLRAKLAGAGVRIETVRGVGFRIVAA